jgi:hypothetical protein
MPLIKDTKAISAADHAARAAREGRVVFLYRQNIGATNSGYSGPVSGMAEVIEAIERQGWALDQMAFDEHQSRNGAILLLFRRAARPAPVGAHADPYNGYYRDGPPPAPPGHRG